MNRFGHIKIGSNQIKGEIEAHKNIAIIILITMVIAIGGGRSFWQSIAKVLHLDAIVFGIIEITR